MPTLLEQPAVLSIRAASVSLEAATPDTDAAPRQFRIVAYTGGPMILGGWKHPVIVDLEGLDIGRQERPILLDHTRDVDFVLGQTGQVAIESHQLIVSGSILGESEKARRVIALNDRGFAWQASIGARATETEFVPGGKSVEVNGQTFEGPVIVARKSVLGEISFVVLGADDNTSARIAAGLDDGDDEAPTGFANWLAAQGVSIDDFEGPEAESVRNYLRLESQAEPLPARPRDPEPPDPVAEMRGRAAAERRRIHRISQICAGEQSELEARAIGEGWDATRTELEVLRASRPKSRPVYSEDGSGRSAPSLEAALCLSTGMSEDQVGRWYDERTMNEAVSRELRGAGLHTLMFEVIRAAGGHVRPGHVDNDTIEAAFNANNQLLQAAGGFSTISLAGILSNVANRTMLSAYRAVPSVVSQFCSATDVNNFQEVTRYRMTASGIFEKVGPDGELKHASLEELDYKNQVKTYGRMIALTRQMMINDDLGVFLQIPRAIGRMSALALEEVVFSLLLSNPEGFFSENNSNYFVGSDSALDIDSLTKGEELFLDRVDSQGKPIYVQPAIILVPTSLKVTAEVLFKETQVNQVPANNKAKPATNPHAGKFRPVSSPYLSLPGLAGSSKTAWYLFADPNDVAAFEIAYLRGRRVPTIEGGSTDFNTLGMQWRGYFDFGTAAQDPRAAVKAAGVAMAA